MAEPIGCCVGAFDLEAVYQGLRPEPPAGAKRSFLNQVPKLL